MERPMYFKTTDELRNFEIEAMVEKVADFVSVLNQGEFMDFNSYLFTKGYYILVRTNDSKEDPLNIKNRYVPVDDDAKTVSR